MVALIHRTVSALCRGKGLSKWLLEVIQAHEDLQGLRRFMLATRDAHGLYAQFGFTALANPSRMMEILDADAYRAPSLHVKQRPRRATK